MLTTFADKKQNRQNKNQFFSSSRQHSKNQFCLTKLLYLKTEGYNNIIQIQQPCSSKLGKKLKQDKNSVQPPNFHKIFSHLTFQQRYFRVGKFPKFYFSPRCLSRCLLPYLEKSFSDKFAKRMLILSENFFPFKQDITVAPTPFRI